jgi:hypothetical protein
MTLSGHTDSHEVSATRAYRARRALPSGGSRCAGAKGSPSWQPGHMLIVLLCEAAQGLPPRGTPNRAKFKVKLMSAGRPPGDCS